MFGRFEFLSASFRSISKTDFQAKHIIIQFQAMFGDKIAQHFGALKRLKGRGRYPPHPPARRGGGVGTPPLPMLFEATA